MRKHAPIYLINLFLFAVVAVFFQNCGDVSLVRSAQESLPSVQATPTPEPIVQAPPMWQTPTVTQSYCDSINGNGDPFEKNSAEGMLCNFFKDQVKEYILAPEMKYFLDYGLPRQPLFIVSAYVQKAGGNSLPKNLADAVIAFQDFQAQINFKITYKLTKGPSEILVPLDKGAFYTVTAPTTEGDWEYQAQIENSYGVSPVKTLKFKIQKAISTINPSNGQITCPGVSNTGVLDLTPYLTGRLVSKAVGPFGQNDVHILKFKMPSVGYAGLSPSNSWDLWRLDYVISTQPCDFITGNGTYARQIGGDSFSFIFTNEFFQPGKTYYLNARHQPGDCPNGPDDDLDCPILTDFHFMDVDVSDKGKRAIGVNNMTNGCYTTMYPWDSVAGKYDFGAATTTFYSGPGNQCVDPY